MTTHLHRLVLASTALLLGAMLPAQEAGGAYWPQWRGPHRDGIARDEAWSVEPGGDPVWTAELGLGYSTVSIADGRLFTMGHDAADESDSVYCLDPRTGEENWKHTFDAPLMNMAHTGGTLSTPSIDGDTVHVIQRTGRYMGFRAATGEVLWDRDMKEEYGLEMPTWGFSAAPLILDDQIVLNMGKVISLDRKGPFDKKGRERWITDNHGHAYSTPTLFEHDGKARLAVFCGDGLVILDAATGSELAKSEWETRYNVNAATPVVHEDRIFISSGYNKGCSMLRFDGESLETLWTNREMRNHMSGCVLFGERLYGFDETQLRCLDLDGNVCWTQRGLGKGALLLADGKILALSGRGELVVAEAGPEEYVELSRQKILDGGRQWTTPVLAGGFVYCRNSRGTLVCVDRRANGDGDSKGGGGEDGP